MEAKAILYHSNEESKCKEFLSNDGFLIVSNNRYDDIWLGSGMYFWDNLGNAKWWKSKQMQRNGSKIYTIVATNVVLERLLDLTDIDITEKFNELWNEVCEKIGETGNFGLGKKLNCLFDILALEKTYDIIKVFGKYNRTTNEGFIRFDYGSKKPEPTLATKCIYSIRNADCIVEKEMCEGE